MINPASRGRAIYIYCHIQTKQVLYSFTRALDKSALKQIPFIGKKSKPPAIRKDHWHPLATVTFPRSEIGLKTFHKLREFRVLHETKYPEDMKMTTTLKERKYKIMDQKANSIADLALSLQIELDRDSASDVKEGEVVVSWANMHDAEYAQKWPQKVKHGEQGRRVRYCAPKVEDMPSTKALAEAVKQQPASL